MLIRLTLNRQFKESQKELPLQLQYKKAGKSKLDLTDWTAPICTVLVT